MIELRKLFVTLMNKLDFRSCRNRARAPFKGNNVKIMLLDLWSFAIIVSDIIDFFAYYIENGSFSVSLSFLAFAVIFVTISIFAWRSTNIPALPPPPNPPYVIQIQGSSTGGGISGRQTLSDVRLLSSGPYVESVLRRYPHAHLHGFNRGQGHRVPGGGSLFFGLLRRPTIRPILPIRPLVRARFNAPNLIVYHRVNVYHHTAALNQNQNSTRDSTNINSNNSSDTGSNNPSFSGNISVTTPDTAESQQTSSSSTSAQTTTESGVIDIDNLLNTGVLPEGAPNYRHHRCQINRPLNRNGIRIEDIIRPDLGASTSSAVNTNGSGPAIEVEVHTEEEVSLVETEEETGLDVDIVDGGVTIVEQNLSTEESFGLRNRSSGGHRVDIANDNSVMESGRQDDRHQQSYSKDETIGPESKKLSTAPATSSSETGNESRGGSSDDVHFTIKFLNDTQMDVTSQLSEKVVDFKRRHFETEMSENKLVRLIFNGRVLDNDTKTLKDSGIFDQCVVHCLIVTRQPTQESASGQGSAQSGRTSGSRIGGRGPEPGMFFVSIMGIILIFLWFICFHFGQQLFTQSAVVSLTVLTAIFLIGLVAFYLPIHPNN